MTTRVRLAHGVGIDVEYGDYWLDCRLLFLGDRYRQLLRAHREVVHRMSHTGSDEDVLAYLNESAEIRQYWRVHAEGGQPAVTMHDAVFHQPAPLNPGDLQLRLGRRNRGIALPYALEDLATLGRLLPLLRGAHAPAEIEAAIAALAPDRQAWAGELWGLLQTRGLLERGRWPEPPPRRGPRATLVGHTSLLFESAGGAAVLTDPMLRVSLGTPARAFELTRRPLAALVITHAHWDHCDLTSLSWFDKRLPVVVPRVRRPSAFNPPIVPALRLLGYSEIHELDWWDRRRFGGIELIAVPFHGEQDEPGAEIDHFTYVLRTEGLSVYGGVDAYHDSFGAMEPVLARVREGFAPDAAFLPVSNMVYRFRHGSVNGFCRHLDTHLMAQDNPYTASPALALEWTRLLGVRRAAPYAVFCLRRTTAPQQIAELVRDAGPAGLGKAILPLPALAALSPEDLRDSPRTHWRRRSLQNWFRIGAAAARLDARLGRFGVWRVARRVLNRYLGRPPPPH